MPNININNLTAKYYKKKQVIQVALDDLTCSFANGKITSIVGSSGSGKTTLLKCILGLMKYEGNISFDDIDLVSTSLKDRNIAYVSQDIVLYPSLNVFQNIAFPLTNSGASIDEIRRRVYEVAKLLNISELLTRKPKQISLGQAQRVCVAKAIVKRAYVYLFDEPFSNLDEKHRFSLRHDLKEILNQIGATAIFVTHSIKEATAISDYIYVMDSGKIILECEPKDLMNTENEIAQQLIKNDNE